MPYEKTILLVEDNPNDEELTLRAFAKNNIKNKVIIVRDGAEALDYLLAEGAFAQRDRSIMPEVVLLDLNLPKIDGLEVLRRIRQDTHLKRLPVVVMTSSKEEQDIVTSYDLGANSYVRKPVDFQKFTESIHQLDLYWLTLNESPAKFLKKHP